VHYFNFSVNKRGKWKVIHVFLFCRLVFLFRRGELA
jgi:hypothetical protein